MWTTNNRARYDRSCLRYPSDLTDDEWALVEPRRQAHGDHARGGERPHVYFVDRLPVAGHSERPAAALDPWSWDGTLDLIHHVLYVKCREALGREASPTAAVIDSESVKSAEKGGRRSIRRVTTRERRSRARSAMFSSTPKAC